ncbi:MAG: efflux RND transporter periplasmic adaptor subunit [Leeuwenhoekiella sp.]
MKNKKITIWILVAILVVIVAYFFFRESDTSQIVAETVPVKKGTVTKMITATGTIEPTNQVEVGTQVSGEVEKLYVDFNSIVTKGQLLAELDKTNLNAALLQAQATYDNAINEKKYLETIYNRQKTLYDNEVISQSDYDDASYNLNNAKSTVTQRLSDLQKAKTNLGYAEIYSPIDGVVLSRDVDEGQTVAASYSTPTLFTIAQDLKKMQVEADVDEADIGEVKEGQRVTFTVDAYQGQEFNGTVTQVRLDPTIESNVVTYTVVIQADNPDLKLKPGLTATVYIYTLELKDVLTIEAKAVNFTPDTNSLTAYKAQKEASQKTPVIPSATGESEKIVWLSKNGNIEPTIIKTGANDGVNVQITSGVQQGDKLVYNLKTVSNAESNVATESESPFMPKPPGKRK